MELDGLWSLEDLLPRFLTYLVCKLTLVVGEEFSCECWLGSVVFCHMGTAVRLLVFPHSMVAELESGLEGRK